jgi:DNA-binding CsgD family transcriptional regulator
MYDLLLERTTELAAIGRAVRMARAGCGRQLLIAGPAGSGRTALLERACAHAEANQLTVLSAGGEERERDFPFALVRRLLEPHTSGVPWTRRYEALLELNRLLVATAPALVVIDDLQWSDAESLDWLAFLSLRLRRTGIVVVAGVDTGAPELIGPLEEAGAIVLPLRPLSEAAVAAMLHVTSGHSVRADFARACHRATAGHPLLVSELAAAAHRSRAQAEADAAEWVASVVPPGVTRFAARRLKPLPQEARALAHGVALLGANATLRDAAALARLDADAAAAACDQLRQAGILTGADTLAITPPLLARGVYETIPPARRALLHAGAARNVLGVVAAARHLLRSEPAGSLWVVATLRRAADEALERGRPGDAVEYLRRADRERVRSDRAGVLVALAAAERRVGDAAEIDRLETALMHGAPPVATTAALARALLAHGRTAEALALADADPTELHAGARLNPGAGHAAAVRLAATGGESRALSACRAAEAACAATSAERAIKLAIRALDGRELDPEAPAYFSACAALAWSDQLALARLHLDRALSHARRLGSVCGLVRAEAGHAIVALRGGELDAAIVHATTAIGGGGATALAVPARAVLVLALLEADRVEDAAASCDADTPELLYARGRVRLARCDLSGALDDFLTVGGELTRDAIQGPALIPWRSAAALALGPAGEGLARDEYALAARFGAPRAVGRALRALAAVGPVAERTERCRAAVAVLAPSEARLEYAHALCDLGASLRRERARRDARDPLRAALDLAVRCGATGLARRAREELAASGARPRRLAQSGPDALTPAELRVAHLAARGLANREIAHMLVVTVKTVETELTHAYAKLGIRSRRELAVALQPVG